EQGKLTADVPKAATGFVINTPRVNVVDIGTRFGVSVEENGDSEVHVMQGVVEVSRLTGNAVPVLLQEGVAVRADDRTRSELQFIEYAGDRFALRVAREAKPAAVSRFLHYGFNESGGPEIEDEGRGFEGGAFDASLFTSPDSQARPKRSVGRQGGGLSFSKGERFDSPRLSGVQSGESMSMAFWVRLPPRLEETNSAPLARLMGNRQKSNSAPQVGGAGSDPLWLVTWNQDPIKGKSGALKVGSGDAYAIGSTDLQDGRWHHLAFRFVGGSGEGDLATHLHLYVDGKLESISGYRSGVVQSGEVERIQVGGEGGEGQWFEGTIDEVFYFPEAVGPVVFQRLANGDSWP
ncbi:MAG: FecR domain-containing protein, partial [Verrucomicrobiae bacterium]|nr:FecR domain-containing protein [Verrucomicrobiae bacterium]